MIDDDPEARRLAHALALAEGFQLFIAVCDGQAVSVELLHFVEREVARIRGEEVTVVAMFPWRRHVEARTSRTEGLDFARLVETVVDPLVHFRQENPDADKCIAWVDASDAVPEDMAAWRQLFQKLNELRNALAQSVGVPLVLSCAPGVEVEFAHAAPDFWSIRSAEIVVGKSEPQPSAATAPAPTAPEADVIREAIAAAEAGEYEQAAGLLVTVGETASNGTIARSARNLSGLISQLDLPSTRFILDGAFRRVETDRRIATSPNHILNVASIQCDVATVLGAIEETSAMLFLDAAARLVDEVERLHRSDPAWIPSLGEAHSNIGAACAFFGDEGAALKHLSATVAYGMDMVSRDPTNKEYAVDLGLSELLLARLHMSFGKHERAIDALNRVFAIAQSLVDRAPWYSLWLAIHSGERALDVGATDLARNATALAEHAVAKDDDRELDVYRKRLDELKRRLPPESA